MAANSKRAKLGPQIMGGSAAPAGSLRTMAIARRSPHSAAAEPLDNESTVAVPLETPVPAADELFFKKGAATAATFRPNYWTYESNRAAVEASEGLEGSGPSEEELSAGDTAGLALVIRPSQPPAILPEVAPVAETPEPDSTEPVQDLVATAALDEPSFITADTETPLAAGTETEAETLAIPPEVASVVAGAPELDFAEPAPEATVTAALDEPSSDAEDIETPLPPEAKTLTPLPEVTPAAAEASEPDFVEPARELAATTVLDDPSSDTTNIETPLAEAETPTILSEVTPVVAEVSEPDFAESAPEFVVTTTLDEPSPDAATIETSSTAEAETPTILSDAASAMTEASEPYFAEAAPEPTVTVALDEPSYDAADIETPLTAETEVPAILPEVAPAAAETSEQDFAEAAPAVAMAAESDSTEPVPEPIFTATLDEPLPATASETTTPVVDEASIAAFDLAVPETSDAMARVDAAPGIDVSAPPASDEAVALFDTPTASEMAVPSPSVALDEAPRRLGDDLSQALQAAIVAPFEPTTAMASENYPEITPETIALQAMPAPLEEPAEEEPAEEGSVETASDFVPTLEVSLPASDAALWEAADADAAPSGIVSLPASDAALWEAADADAAPSGIGPPATDLIAPALAAEAPPSDLDQASPACEAYPAAEPDIAGAVGEAPDTILPTEAAPIIAAPPPARKEKRSDPRLAAEQAAQDAGAVELAAMIESVLIDKSYQKAARSAAVTPLSTAMRMGRQPRARLPRPRPATPPKPLAQAATLAAVASVAPKRRTSNRLLVLICLGVILPATFYATALRHGDTQDSAALTVAAPAAAPSEDLTSETVSAFNETTTLHPAPIRPSHKPHYPAITHSPVR